MAESRQLLQNASDDDFERYLRDLGTAVAYPAAGADAGGVDVAAGSRARIVALDIHPGRGGLRRWPWFGLGSGTRPMRRSFVLAIAALLVLAAIAAAVGLGLPGIRIIFGEVPSPTPRPVASSAAPSSLAPPGSTLGLGTALPLAEVERLAGFDLILPTNPDFGPPDVAYLAGQRAALLWTDRPGLPSTGVDGIGLLISEFRGTTDPGYFTKIIDTGTIVKRVTVNGAPGFWITGAPHFFFYVAPDGSSVDDSHRLVGDVLIWSTGDKTYRLESRLDMDAAIRLAESLD